MSESIYRIRENTYGSAKRLDWIRGFLRAEDRVLEFGCGTGVMISLPLTLAGYDVCGVDLDEQSIEYGREICRRYGVDPARLACADVRSLPGLFDVVIASEVLEHIPTAQLSEILDVLVAKVRPGGLLLVTVPNGYGWFELESMLWNKLRFGAAIERLQIPRIVLRLKKTLIGHDGENPYPNTMADATSPHVQRFTLRSIGRLLELHGLRPIDTAGSVLYAGPFSNLLITGIPALMAANSRLGSMFRHVASGFLIACRVPQRSESVLASRTADGQTTAVI